VDAAMPEALEGLRSCWPRFRSSSSTWPPTAGATRARA